MLALDNHYWNELSHAYGKAGDIPALLHQLAKTTAPGTSYDSEPWYSLWSSLCHQGDTYEASYAAVPHIVQTAKTATWPIAFDFLCLPTAIEVARATNHGPAVPVKLKPAYEAAIQQLVECVAIHRQNAWDDDFAKCAAAALCAAKGHHKMAQAIFELDEYWIDRVIEKDTSR